MSTFKRRHEVLESLARSWKRGRDVIVQVVGHTQTEADQETEDPSETRHENYTSVEQVEEDKPTGNADERELGADDELVNEVSIQNENKEKIVKENSVSTHVDPRKDSTQNSKKRPSEGSGSDRNWPPEEKEENRKSE